MRKASEVEGGFPFLYSTNCYIEVFKDGTVNNIPHKNKSDRYMIKEAYDRVVTGESNLYCAWPGNYSTDLFIIDDINALSDAFGLPNNDLSTKKN
jgi:hypothetical protein